MLAADIKMKAEKSEVMDWKKSTVDKITSTAAKVEYDLKIQHDAFEKLTNNVQTAVDTSYGHLEEGVTENIRKKLDEASKSLDSSQYEVPAAAACQLGQLEQDYGVTLGEFKPSFVAFMAKG